MLSDTYQPRNVLVTGGAGFIGSHFIRYLLKTFPEVFIVNLDSLTYAGQLANLPDLIGNSHYEFIQGNITDAKLLAVVLSRYSIDTIVHFAAETHVDRSIQNPTPFIQSNVVGTFVLLEAARHYWLTEKKWTEKQCRFHHISTDEVFGSLSQTGAAFTETTAYAPNSPYSASKAGSDHLVRAYFHTYQLPVSISHCSNNYGPHQHNEKLIPTIIYHCKHQTPIPIYGNGANIRDWLYVEDHCNGIETILTRGKIGEGYNIGGINEVNNLTMAKTICNLFNEKYPDRQPHERLITFVADRPGHDWRYAMNINKMVKELGWHPKETLLSGLKKTIDFYLAE